MDRQTEMIIKNNPHSYRDFIQTKFFEIFGKEFDKKDIFYNKLKFGNEDFHYVSIDYNNDIGELDIFDYTEFISKINPQKFKEICELYDYDGYSDDGEKRYYVDNDSADYIFKNYKMKFDLKQFYRIVKMKKIFKNIIQKRTNRVKNTSQN